MRTRHLMLAIAAVAAVNAACQSVNTEPTNPAPNATQTTSESTGTPIDEEEQPDAGLPPGIMWTAEPLTSEAFVEAQTTHTPLGWVITATFFRGMEGAPVPAVFLSQDGLTWTQTLLPTPPDNTYVTDGVAYGSGGLVIAGTGGLWNSPDGSTWAFHSLDAGEFRGVVYTGNRYLAVAQYVSGDLTPWGFEVWQSQDGENWDMLTRHVDETHSMWGPRITVSGGQVIITVGQIHCAAPQWIGNRGIIDIPGSPPRQGIAWLVDDDTVLEPYDLIGRGLVEPLPENICDDPNQASRLASFGWFVHGWDADMWATLDGRVRLITPDGLVEITAPHDSHTLTYLRVGSQIMALDFRTGRNSRIRGRVFTTGDGKTWEERSQELVLPYDTLTLGADGVFFTAGVHQDQIVAAVRSQLQPNAGSAGSLGLTAITSTTRDSKDAGCETGRGVICQNALLAYTQMQGADLENADLAGADMTAADLTQANLHGARLHRTTLFYAQFPGADLTGADLTYADLGLANLTDADLTGASFRGAIISDTKFEGATCPNGQLAENGSCEGMFLDR